jgi:hypothetical protein
MAEDTDASAYAEWTCSPDLTRDYKHNNCWYLSTLIGFLLTENW